MSATTQVLQDHLAGRHADEPNPDCRACSARPVISPLVPPPARGDQRTLGSGRTCECGCLETVGPKARFRPGHDAKLKSRLVAEARKECRCLMSGDNHIETCGPNNARLRLKKLGWDKFI